MVVNSSEEKSQDCLNVVELPDEGTTGPLCESHLNMVNLSNLNLVKTPIPMDAQSNGGNHANLKNDSADVYGSYCLDIDIEKGKFELPKSTEEMSGNAKTDDCISRMLQREISSLMGGKLMQLLMNNSFELPKFACKDASTALLLLSLEPASSSEKNGALVTMSNAKAHKSRRITHQTNHWTVKTWPDLEASMVVSVFTPSQGRPEHISEGVSGGDKVKAKKSGVSSYFDKVTAVKSDSSR